MKADVNYSIRAGMLTIARKGGVDIWRGLPDGLGVIELRPASDGRSALVLLDPPLGAGRVQNLVRMCETGDVMWWAPGRRGDAQEGRCRVRRGDGRLTGRIALGAR